MKWINSTNWQKRIVIIFNCFLTCVLFAGCQTLTNSDSVIAQKTEPNNNNSNINNVNEDFNRRMEERERQKLKSEVLEQNRKLWLEKNIVNYDLIVRFDSSGFTPYASPVKIKVRNNKNVLLKQIEKGNQQLTNNYDNLDTVEKMFNQFQKELEEGAYIKGTFNSELGYPEDIVVNHFRSTGFYHIYIDKLDIVEK